MSTPPPIRRAREEIASRLSDPSALFVSIRELRTMIEEVPSMARAGVVESLDGVLWNERLSRTTTALFLFREAAEALTTVMSRSIEPSLSAQASAALQRAAREAGGAAHRAAAEALGNLPLDVRGPRLEVETPRAIRPLSWDAIRASAGALRGAMPTRRGRTWLLPISGDRVLAVKTANTADGAAALAREALWMEHLRNMDWNGARSIPPQNGRGAIFFHVPRPLRIDGELLHAPMGTTEGRENPENAPACAIAYVAHPGYFRYPNEPEPRRLPFPRFKEVLGRCAWLLGRLASLGIVHTAPIPLFHNRVQRERRNDGGVYDWRRGGRLDRWLESCRYPNLGLSGLRDFEHLEPASGAAGELYRHVGSHFLSLVLVAGSWFRCGDPAPGAGLQGPPVDTRHLFDADRLESLIETCYHHYHEGFTGATPAAKGFDYARLCSRLIDEMGVDRHMEEILRTPDQQAMTVEQFHAFLIDRGFSKEQAATMVKGEADVTLITGPHLGGFNQRISVPELIEFVAVAAATCISSKYRTCRRI